MLQHLGALVSWDWPHKEKYETRKAGKYLKDNNIVIGVRSICRILGRKVTGAPGVRWTHLMDVPGHVRIWIHVVQKHALRLEGFRNLGKDARETFQYLKESKSDYSLKHTGNIIPDSPSSYLGRGRAFPAERLESPLPISGIFVLQICLALRTTSDLRKPKVVILVGSLRLIWPILWARCCRGRTRREIKARTM